MLNQVSFLKCVRDNLRAKGFGKKRMDEIEGSIRERAAGHREDGKDNATAMQLAANDILENMSKQAVERAKRNAKMLTVQASTIDRVSSASDVDTSLFVMDGKPGSEGVAIARAAVSLIEDDPRFEGLSYSTYKENTRGVLYAAFGDAMEAVSKGAFGRQKGKAHLPNIVREIKGKATGDAKAKAVADAWLKVQDLTVDMFEQAGGSMNRVKNYLPQQQNTVKVSRAGEGTWVKMHLDTLDWEVTRWPDGTRIKPEQREEVLKRIFETISTDGASKLDPTAFRGRGRALGNALDNHRFMHYKDAEAWMRVHEAFGEGNPFDVLVSHIEMMSHKIAAVQAFGPNPEMAAMNVRAIVKHEAAKHGAKAVADADAILKNKFDPMLETVMRENPMDPHSTFGNLVTGVGNILTSAQLGSAALLAIPGDFMQTAAVRALNRQGMFDGVSTYVKAIATDRQFSREIAQQSGFVMDEAVMATYSQTRFTGVATVGPAMSRHISEATMRLSLLSGHTRAARWTAQAEFMGMMHRMKDVKFDDLPFVHVARRYGIEAKHWDAMRKSTKPWQPRKGASFMRPIDILQSEVADKTDVFNRFQGMIYEEARKMVPEATVEGTTTLRSTTRPDTLAGALLYSFSMYKNFPVSFMMIYGRLGMTSPHARGRIGFYAGLGAGMVLVGALGTQLREMSKGRDPMPMDTPAFWGKAALSGGALSIYGDFLFAGVNEYGRGPAQMFAGPIAGALGDTADLVLGDVFTFAETLGSLSEEGFESKTLAKAVEWARRYTPGSSIWWARLALERHMFDRLQELADPRAYRKWQNKIRSRQRDYDQGYWWSPGETSPSREPQLGG